MTDFQTARRPHRAIKWVLLGVALLLALFWAGAWLLHLSQGSLLAASLAIGILGLVAIAVRVAWGRSERAQSETAQQRPAVAVDQAFRTWAGYPANTAIEEPAAVLNGKRWSLDVFAAIDAQRFAAVCETWFSWAGFDTRSEAHRTNEGVDIWLHAAKMPGPVAIVRCKHWLNKPVGLPEMKDFLGLVATYQHAHGTYTTTSTYTPEALQFAREHGIDAVDGRSLLRRIQTRTRQRQQALLAVAYNGHS